MSNLALVGGTDISPTELVRSLSSQDKATIMSLCMPKNATDSDLAMYLYRCKTLGFDPLSGELVLQKRIMKDGEVRLNFVTTRDAYLRKAEQNSEYQGINSGVVKEGDTFLIDSDSGTVKHSFGIKRGKILAGWAIVYHKNRKPVIATADFVEYLNANASSPVWRSMPSAMVQKVAEVAALRRQFPIQGIYTAEEMVLEEDQPVPLRVVNNQQVEQIEHIAEESFESTDVEKIEAATNEQISTPEQPMTLENVYQLKTFMTGKSPSGVPYGKINATYNDDTVFLLAEGEEALAEAAKLDDDCLFTAELYEKSGFQMIKTITRV